MSLWNSLLNEGERGDVRSRFLNIVRDLYAVCLGPARLAKPADLPSKQDVYEVAPANQGFHAMRHPIRGLAFARIESIRTPNERRHFEAARRLLS